MSMPIEQAPPLHFDITMEPAVSGHRATIVVAPRGLRRELVASDCEELRNVRTFETITSGNADDPTE